MRYHTTRETTASPEHVWRALIDVESWPGWMTSYTSIRRMDHGALGVGSTAKVRQPGLKDAVFRVTDLVPGAEFTWTSTTAGVRTTARHVVMPRVGGAAGIDLQLDQRGLLAPLVGLVLARKIRDFLTIEAAGLCVAAESAAADPSAR
jgi:uncharacterized protein YndB with AHSA1/START domain